MKKLISVLICLLLLTSNSFCTEKWWQEAEFYYVVSISSALLYYVERDLTDKQRERADRLVSAAVDSRMNYAAWNRVQTEQGQNWAHNFLTSSYQYEQEAHSLYFKAEESSMLSGLFLTLGVASLGYAIYKTVDNKKAKVRVSTQAFLNGGNVVISYNF